MNTLKRVIRFLDRVGELSRWANVVGLIALSSMIAVTCIDVILRYFFSRPIKGVSEITELMMIAAIFLAIAHTYNEKGHVSVDLISLKLTPKSRAVMEFITGLLGLCLFIITFWQSAAYSFRSIVSGVPHANLLPVPKAPFASIITLGIVLLCLLLLRDLLNKVVESKNLGLKRSHWLLMIGIPIIVIVLATVWMQPTVWQLNTTAVGLIAVVFFILFLVCGMPVAFVLIMTSFVFIGQIRGPGTALDLIGTEFYRVAGSYQWVAVAFFVLMGFFCLHARFGEDLYDSASRWFGRMPGGLAVATVGACTGFAAIVGDAVAATATMGPVSLPQTRKYKYDDRLSTGSIMGGATLGPIVPPSVPFVIYGILTGVSIGKLFIAGIIPGLLLAFAFSLLIFFWCRLKPDAGPPGGKATLKQRLLSLRATGPVVVLFLLCVGGIYGGIFSPTEGGAIGALGAVCLALSMRRFTLKNFSQSLQEAGKVISMVFLILIGATMFSRLAAWCYFSDVLQNFATSLPVMSVVVIMLLIYFILGCVIDILPLVLIGVPILHPIVASQGIDPIWFAILMNLVINVGSLTPPVGLLLFVLKGMYKDIPISTIYLGALPFVLVTVIIVALIFAIPSLATWLPNILQ